MQEENGWNHDYNGSGENWISIQEKRRVFCKTSKKGFCCNIFNSWTMRNTSVLIIKEASQFAFTRKRGESLEFFPFMKYPKRNVNIAVFIFVSTFLPRICRYHPPRCWINRYLYGSVLLFLMRFNSFDQKCSINSDTTKVSTWFFVQCCLNLVPLVSTFRLYYVNCLLWISKALMF